MNTYIYGLIIALFAILLLILAVGSVWINLFDKVNAKSREYPEASECSDKETVVQCKKCGKSVKYIKSHDNTEVYTVDTDIILVVKSNGREVGGYLVHECEGRVKDHETNKQNE